MPQWVTASSGVMRSILFDNGGEFSNSEMREVASMTKAHELHTCTLPS